jgi:hypothetical protein
LHWRQKAALETGRKVQIFLRDNAEAVGNVSRAKYKDLLDAAITGMDESATVQEAMNVERTSRTKMKNKLRAELIDQHLKPIVAIANKKPTRTASIAGMRLPPQHASDGSLLTKAAAMAARAARYPDVFAAQQMPLNHVQHCRGKIKELRDELKRRDGCLMRHARATADLADYVSRVRNAIYVLNALVVKELRASAPGLLQAWKSAKRYPQKTGPKRPRKARTAKAAKPKRARRRKPKRKENQS